MDISLTGRAAIITGGSKGIGFGIAQRFAQSGADIAIVARGRDALAQAETQIRADRRQECRHRPGRCRQRGRYQAHLRRSDAQARQASISSSTMPGTSRAGPFENLTDEIMQQDLDQKFFAALRLTRLAWEQMKEPRLGPHHQCSQYRRQGATRRQRADDDFARRRHGADQGAGRARARRTTFW